jgi:hypothetical protein
MTTRAPPGDYDDLGDPVWAPNILGNTGSVGGREQPRPEPDAVQRLRDVVAEVTNGRIPAPQRRGPGFY